MLALFTVTLDVYMSILIYLYFLCNLYEIYTRFAIDLYNYYTIITFELNIYLFIFILIISYSNCMDHYYFTNK